jgi:hypothetical protein
MESDESLLDYDHPDARLRAWGFESDSDHGIPMGAWPVYDGDEDERRRHLAAFIASLKLSVLRAKGKAGAIGRLIIERRVEGEAAEAPSWESLHGPELPSDEEVERAIGASKLVLVRE